MVTAADGADSFYTSANNVARYESVPEAVARQKVDQLMGWTPSFQYHSERWRRQFPIKD